MLYDSKHILQTNKKIQPENSVCVIRYIKLKLRNFFFNFFFKISKVLGSYICIKCVTFNWIVKNWTCHSVKYFTILRFKVIWQNGGGTGGWGVECRVNQCYKHNGLIAVSVTDVRDNNCVNYGWGCGEIVLSWLSLTHITLLCCG